MAFHRRKAMGANGCAYASTAGSERSDRSNVVLSFAIEKSNYISRHDAASSFDADPARWDTTL
jgi:hypothetical protein